MHPANWKSHPLEILHPNLGPPSQDHFAALVWKPLGITSTRVPAFFFFRVNALNYAGVNERTEEKAGVGSPAAPSEGDKAYSSAAALSALGRAQIKRGLGGKETGGT